MLVLGLILLQKQSKEAAVRAILRMLIKPEIQRAIQAIRDIRNDTANEQTAEDITAGVLVGKQGYILSILWLPMLIT